MKRRLPATGRWLPLLLIALIGAAAYLTSLRNGFVYDDEYTVVRNSLIKSPYRLPHLFRGDYFALSAEQSYRPLVTLSYFADYSFWGLNPFGYHLTNLLLHLATASILFLFLTELMSRIDPGREHPYVPLVATALFAVHPINSEAVNCISFREDILCALWYLLALLLYVRGRWYGLSLLFFGLALLSKQMALTLPLIIVALDLPGNTRRKGTAARLWRYAGYLAVCAAYAAVAWGVLPGKAPFRASGIGPGLWTACVKKLAVVACDFASFILPVRLSVEYSVPLPGPWSAALLVLFFLAACGGLVMGLFSKRWRDAAFGGLWFLITLLPVSGLYPIFNLRADRYLYLPSMGLCLAAACLIDRITARAVRDRPRLISARLILPAVLVCVLGALTALRSTVWRDNFTLWSDAVRKAPSSARAHTILGNALLDRNDRQGAFREYRRAIVLDPRFVDAYNDLGTLLCEAKNYEEAIRAFHWALRFYPRHAEAHHNLAITYVRMGRTEDAEREFRRAIELNPGLADAYLQLALLHLGRGNEVAARRDFTRALELNPDLLRTVIAEANRMAGLGEYADAALVLRMAAGGRAVPADLCFSLGECAERMGNMEEAAGAYRRAVERDPSLARAWDNLGRIRFRQGKWGEAIECHRRALSIQPKSTQSLIFLGQAYLEGGQYREAAGVFREAMRLRPDLIEAQDSLGVALSRTGDYAGARREWEAVLTRAPGYEPAERNLRALREAGH